jgi:MFS family permease
MTPATTNKTHRGMLLPWVVWCIGTLYFLFDYMNQVVPGAMQPELRHAFGASAFQFGLIAASYFYIYAAMQIPVGMLGDRFGPKRPLAVASIVAATGCILFTQADSFATATLARMMIGIGACFSFVSVLMLIRNWFPGNRFSLLVGLTNMAGMIGAIGADNILSHLAMPEHAGWRDTIAGLGIAGGIIAIGIIFIVRDTPRNAPRTSNDASSEGVGAAWKYLGEIVRSPQVWINGVYAATIATTFMTFGAAWGSLFLRRAFHLTPEEGASLASLVFVGAIPGSFFFGWFSGKVKRRKLPMIIGAAGGLASFLLLAYGIGDSVWLARILLFSMGFFCCGNVVAYALGDDLSPRGGEGIGLGFVNTCLIGGGAGFGPLIGLLLDWQHPVSKTGHTLYTMGELQIAFLPVTICLSLSLLTSLFIRETHCQQRT